MNEVCGHLVRMGMFCGKSRGHGGGHRAAPIKQIVVRTVPIKQIVVTAPSPRVCCACGVDISHMSNRAKRCPKCKVQEHRSRTRHRRRNNEAGVIVEIISRSDLLNRDHGRCYICGITITIQIMQIEHVIPIARVKLHPEVTLHGVRACCPTCNLDKRDMDHAKYILWRWLSGQPVIQAPCAMHPEVAEDY